MLRVKYVEIVMKTLNFDEDKIKEGLITLDKLKKLWKEL